MAHEGQARNSFPRRMLGPDRLGATKTASKFFSGPRISYPSHCGLARSRFQIFSLYFAANSLALRPLASFPLEVAAESPARGPDGNAGRQNIYAPACWP
jgi:hypothetical protein